MKTIAPKRQKSITLREYMHNTSLKKRVSSRASSKQKRQLTITSNNGQIPRTNLMAMERDKLVDEIKLTLAKTIQSQITLAQILKMLAKLIQLFNREIYDKHCQNGLLETMLHSGAAARITQSKWTQETNIKLSVPESLNASLKNYEEAKSRKSSVQVHHHYRNPSNTSSEQIPNINVLLMTRNEPLFERIKDQQTEETLLEHSFQTPNEEESKISIQINQTKDEDRGFINNYDRLMKSSNRGQGSSDASVHSYLWKKNNDENSFLSKFQELKQRIGK